MAATSWSGFWGDAAGGSGAYSLLYNQMPRLNSIRRVIHRDAFRQAAALLNAVLGAAPGAVAAGSHKRIAAFDPTSGPVGGGVRTVETVTDINRATTAADVTALKALLTIAGVKFAPTLYPANAAGQMNAVGYAPGPFTPTVS